jgi:hypothetical protein
VTCAKDIADGRDSVACRWRAEPGGFFLDFTRFGNTLHLAVHEMTEESEGDPRWNPVRGHAHIVTKAGTHEFLDKLCAALRRLHKSESQHPAARRHPPEIDLSIIEGIERSIAQLKSP